MLYTIFIKKWKHWTEFVENILMKTKWNIQRMLCHQIIRILCCGCCWTKILIWGCIHPNLIYRLDFEPRYCTEDWLSFRFNMAKRAQKLGHKYSDRTECILASIEFHRYLFILLSTDIWHGSNKRCGCLIDTTYTYKYGQTMDQTKFSSNTQLWISFCVLLSSQCYSYCICVMAHIKQV